MATPTFQDFVDGPWRTACYRRCKASTRRRVDSALQTQLFPRFGRQSLDEICRADVLLWFDRYSQTAPGGANRTLDVLRQIMNHAVDCGHIAGNPTWGVSRNSRPQLTRFLSRDEIDRLHVVLDSHHGRGSGQQQTEIIRLLLLTGCRKGEIVRLRWSEVGENALHLADSKTGPRTVLLSTQAQAILKRQPRKESEFVFPSLRDSSHSRSIELSLWRKVRKQARIEDVRLHDLRHNFASHAVMNGVPVPVVSRLLGHSNTGMTLRYAHVGDWDTQVAAERVGTAIAAALAGPVHPAANRRRQPTSGDEGAAGPRNPFPTRLSS